MNPSKYISIFCLIFLSCTNQKEKGIVTDKEINTTTDTLRLNFNCSTIKDEFTLSKLEEKVISLYQLDNKYKQIKKNSLQEENSILLEGLNRYIESKNSYDTSQYISLTKNLNSSIIQSNFAYVKGETDLSENLYARASIEEHIFSSVSCASNFMNNLSLIIDDENKWYDIDKSPSSIYQEDERIYYISTGGWYMKPFYKEIVNQFKRANDDISNCKSSELAVIKNKADKHPLQIGIKDAEILLRNSTNNCKKNNAEYSEFYNGVLFDVALLNPKSIQELLMDGKFKNENKEALLSELESPIADDIFLDGIKSKFWKLEENEWKDKMIESIQRAISKYE